MSLRAVAAINVPLRKTNISLVASDNYGAMRLLKMLLERR